MPKKIITAAERLLPVLIVVLFLAYCFSDETLRTDFRAYVASFDFPVRKTVRALLIFLAFLYAARKLGSAVWLKLCERLRLDIGTAESVSAAGRYAALCAAALIALSVWGVNFKSLGIFVGALSVGLGFGLQNIANNFVSGVLLLFEHPFSVGDWIVLGDKEGIVKKISLRSTEIESFDKSLIVIPNADILSGEPVIRTRPDGTGRLTVSVGVDYAANLDKALKLAVQEAGKDPRVLKTPPPSAVVASFDDNAVGIKLNCYVENVLERANVQSGLMIRLCKAFGENGIDIPFPRRVVSLKRSSTACRRDRF